MSDRVLAIAFLALWLARWLPGMGMYVEKRPAVAWDRPGAYFATANVIAAVWLAVAVLF